MPPSDYLGVCAKCYYPVYDYQAYRWSDKNLPEHTDCEASTGVSTKQTSDEKYNALCATLDRIMTGNPAIRVRGGAVSSVAETWRDEKGLAAGRERAVVRFDHDAIKKWATDSWDRTALTLALNIHELGHLWHSPAYGSGARSHSADTMFFMNVLDDQRQEMLSTLAYPKAIDYLRFLNVRGLQKHFEENAKLPPEERTSKLGRQYMLHYGRRHLYPPSLNKELRDAAYAKYGLVDAGRIEMIIDEFMALDLDQPLDMGRAWLLAVALSDIDSKHDPETGGNIHSTLVIGDPRHDCAPMDGMPSLTKEQREKLTKQLRELMKSAPSTPEPTKAQKQRAQKPKQRGENPEPVEEKPEASQKQEKEQKQDEGTEVAQAPGKGATQEDQEGDSDPEEGEGDAESEAESGSEVQGGDGEGSEGAGDLDDDETDSPSRGAGVNDNPTLEDHAPEEENLLLGPDDLDTVLDALEESALDRIESEVDDRHRAFRKSEMRPEMGGKRKGSLAPNQLATAKRLGLMFKNINQDLVPQTERALRHGRVDARRLPLVVTTNTQRIFKRRVKDLSRDAALAVFILIDVSSSMDDNVRAMKGGRLQYVGTKTEVALDAGFTLAKGVELAGHMAKVVEFSDMDFVAKDWLDTIYHQTKRPGSGGTQATASLRRAQVDFPYIQKEVDIHNHVLIILTDGAWADSMASELILHDLVKKGVFVIAVGIQTDPVPIPGAWKVIKISDPADIASAMVDPLRKLAVDIAKNIRRRVA